MAQNLDIAPLDDTTGDPIVIIGGKYYYLDETWSNETGPYKTEEEAQKALEEYAKHV